MPLAGQAKDKVIPLAGKAKDAAAKGVDRAAGGLDSATGHKYHDKLTGVTGNREKNPTVVPDPAQDTVSTEAEESESEGVERDGTRTAASDSPTEPADPDVPTAAADTKHAPAPGPEAGIPTIADEPDTATDAVNFEADATSVEVEHQPTPADMPAHRPDPTEA